MADARDPQPILIGANVVLRPWTAGDADWVFAACQDVEIQRWTTVPSPYTQSDAVGYVGAISSQAWQDGGAVFAVTDAATGELAGAIGAHGLSEGVAHVGYWTAPAARGRGLTSEALGTLTRWFLHDGGAARVELIVEPDNAASIRVAEAAGFVREGVLRQRFVLRNVRADVVMYSRLPDDPHE